ncbi:Translation initiation factor 3 complex subunit L [Babesia duncani]|uniref:Translation initiation factor 3 complex subunit L n=1 Tax=Babesia duncani TaxID=323732 RepID=A0AAD9PN90_9APIC|nr:Translation initiation factor 3 complex subunit L [Babesia duncani]
MNDDFGHVSLGSETPQRSINSVLPRESEVVDFLVRLHDNMYHRNSDAVKLLYEQELNVITEKYYKSSRWPAISDVAGFYSQSGRLHSLIMALYSEIYYRHVFVLGDITYEDRTDSWDKYVKLLSYFIQEIEATEDDQLDPLIIPTSWLWDMLDEFVYQLQECCRWRSRLGISMSKREGKSLEGDMEKANSIWRVPVALDLLHRLASNATFKNFVQSPRVRQSLV